MFEQGGPVKARHHGRPAQHGSGVGVRTVHALQEGVIRALEGLVGPAAQRALRHAALGLDLGIGQRGTKGHVRDQLEHPLPVSRKPAGADLGGVRVARGADGAPDVLGRLGDGERGAGLGALHQHMLQEIGDAGIVLALPARAHADEHGHGHHRRARVLAHQHGEPAGQTLAQDHGLGGAAGAGQEQTGEQRAREKAPDHRTRSRGLRTSRAFAALRYRRAASRICSGVTARIPSR